MISTPPIVDKLFLERVRKARKMSPAEKFLAGEQLFESACEWTKVGILMNHPGADETEVLDRLKQRLALVDRLERTHEP